MEPLLQLQDVSKTYLTTSDAAPVHVLNAVSFSLAQAETAAIVGPSGSGKSTLLNIIGTLDKPTTGIVRLDGRDMAKLNDQEVAVVRNHQIGFIFQAHHLLPHCSVLENVLIPTLAKCSVLKPSTALERARRLIDRVGLTSRLNHRPSQLSGGERQRVAVVRALINRPKLLLADEPTGALDRASAQTLAQVLVDLNREEKTTIIVVTHSLELSKLMARQFDVCDGAVREK